MIKQLAHVCLTAKDLEATQQFYCEGLGLNKLFDFRRGGKRIGFYLTVAPGSFIEVFVENAWGDGPPAASAGPISHICFEVDDIDDAVDRLKTHAFEVGKKSFGPDNSWQAWTADPAGVRIELHQYTPKSAQITGQDCLL